MFEIHKAQDEQYYVIAKASNGEILMTSETYTQKHNAFNCIRSLLDNIASTNNALELIQDKTGE